MGGRNNTDNAASYGYRQTIPLNFIKGQPASYLGETDIVHSEDALGRI